MADLDSSTYPVVTTPAGAFYFTGYDAGTNDPANRITDASLKALFQSVANTAGKAAQRDTDGSVDVGAVNLDTAASPTGQEGQIRWNATDKCAEVVQDGGVVVQIGQEVTVRARNTTGSALTNGTPVYVVGATGNRPTIAKADADTISKASTLIGLVTDSAGIANNSDGHVTVFGLVRDLDTSAYAEGATLYLSDGTSGTLTATKPTATSSFIVRVGYVTRSHASQGVILVSPQYMGSVTGDAVVNAATPAAARAAIDAQQADADLTAYAASPVTEVAAKSWTASQDPDELMSLRDVAQISSLSSNLISLTTSATVSGSANSSTWQQITGTAFSFVAPASGKVLVRIRFGYTMPSGVASLNMRLNSANAEVTGTTRRIAYQPASGITVQGQGVYETYLTNLSPGVTYSYAVAINNADSAGSVSVVANATFGPMIFAVESLPGAAVDDTTVSIRFGAANLPFWTAGKAAVVAASRDAKILCIGDSTMHGYLLDSMTVRLTTKLAARGLSVQNGGTVPGLSPGGNPRYTAGTGWPSGLLYGFGSQGWQYSNPAGTLQYADSTVNADRWDVYYLQSSGSTSITTQVNNETPVVTGTTGSTTIAKLTVSAVAAASTSHVLKITAVGTGAILFVEPWLSTSRRIRVANAGCPSTNSLTWATGTGIYSRSMMQSYAPDLVICLLGANDAIGAYTAAQVMANISELAAAVPTADFLILSPIPCQIAGEYALMLKYAARERYLRPWPMVDLLRHFGTWDQANANGWMSDLRHPNAAGYDQMATLIDTALAV